MLDCNFNILHRNQVEIPRVIFLFPYAFFYYCSLFVLLSLQNLDDGISLNLMTPYLPQCFANSKLLKRVPNVLSLLRGHQ